MCDNKSPNDLSYKELFIQADAMLQVMLIQCPLGGDTIHARYTLTDKHITPVTY